MGHPSKQLRRKSNTAPRPPRVFFSYTHESERHKRWVLKLATDLRRNGVDAILDRWDCKLGADLTLFMENGIRSSDRVLLVCTPTYRKKAAAPRGGVGYERLVVTGEIAKNIKTEKFVCVLRAGKDQISIPPFALARLFIDFREDSQYEVQLLELLHDIHADPSTPKPPVGRNPFARTATAEKQPLVKTSEHLPSERANDKPPIGANPLTPEVMAAMHRPIRRRLYDTRTAINHKFDISGHEVFITVGLFENGQPGELQIRLSREGSTIGGLLDSVAILTSIALQYGVPLQALVAKFSHMRFEPSGLTKNPDIRSATSIMDYIFRWLAFQFVPGYREDHWPTTSLPDTAPREALGSSTHSATPQKAGPQSPRPSRHPKHN
jgi:hypothetical protein